MISLLLLAKNGEAGKSERVSSPWDDFCLRSSPLARTLQRNTGCERGSKRWKQIPGASWAHEVTEAKNPRDTHLPAREPVVRAVPGGS